MDNCRGVAIHYFKHLKPLAAFISLPLLFACNSATSSNNGATVPDAPTNVTGVPGDSQVTVTWTLLSSGGSAITGYGATAVQDTSRHCVSGAATYCVVKGLVNNVPYSFTVTASNSVGTSIPSMPSLKVIPVASITLPPDAPRNVTVKAGNTKATVSWTGPVSNGGSSITGYKALSARDSSKYCMSTSASFCVVTGLTNDTAYSFIVVAMNGAGVGPASLPSTWVTPVILGPDAPTNVIATASIGRITVSWSASLLNDGPAITGYTAEALEDTSKHCTTADTLCIVTGLSDSTAYTFSVTATNAFGTSEASVPSSPATLPTRPSPPTDVKATARVSQVTVSWSAASDGGSAVTGFMAVALEDTSKRCTSVFITSCVVTGLTNDMEYTFTVTAINQVGKSDTSTHSIPVTPSAVPGVNWEPRTSGTTNTLVSIAWTGAQFVVLEGRGGILTSPNGEVWTSRTFEGSKLLLSVTWTGPLGSAQPGKLVGLGDSGIILTSPDGVSWTSRISGTKSTLYSVTWTGPSTGSGTGQFVAVGANGSIVTSSDGVTWTSRTSGTSNYLYSVTWTGPSTGSTGSPQAGSGTGQLVAVGGNGSIVTSADGVTWTSRTSGTPNYLYSVAWTGPSTGSTGSPQAGSGTGQLVAVGGNGSIVTSSNGVTWTSRTSGTPNYLYSVTWTGPSTGSGTGQLVAVGSYGAVRSSSDGVIWASRISGTKNYLYSATWTGTQLVAVGANGTVLVSPRL